MKIIKKYWGVVLAIVLLSTMFVGSAAPVNAGNYNFSNDLTQPSTVTGVLGFAGNSVMDVAQSGSTIYAVTQNVAGFPFNANYLYISPNGGGMWYPAAATGLPNVTGTDAWVGVAVASDNPSIVAVVNRVALAADRVWISTNGGTSFRALPVLAGTSFINSMDISSIFGSRFLAIGGNNAGVPFVWSWEVDIATTWVNPDDPTFTFSTYATVITPTSDVKSVTFSENFGVDQALLVTTETAGAGGDVTLHCYSYMFTDWDADLGGFAFPRILKAATVPATLVCNRVTVVLDANFTLGDNELGFIGADIVTPAASEGGGVWRINTGMGCTQIYSPAGTLAAGFTGINSVAWDGTNLMAANYDVLTGGILTVYRCANALASTGWLFIPSSPLKTPGTGTDPLVLFNGGAAYCFSQGANSAVARSTDLGKSFDGVALCNTNFNNIVSFWVSGDGARKYVLTDDAAAGDVNVWSLNGGVWKRAAILRGESGNAWMVRAAQSDPNAVYLGQQTTKNMYKALDGGDFIWTKRSCTQNIQDFAVQNATTVYVAVNAAATVVKSTTGAAGWIIPPVATGLAAFFDTCYSLSLVANDQVIVGGNAGTVAYSNNGATSFNMIFSGIAAGGATIATSTLTDGVISTGDTIFAASWAPSIASVTGFTSSIAKWQIGTNTPTVGWDYDILDTDTTTIPGTTFGLPAAQITGLVYANGILYAWDDAANPVLPPGTVPTVPQHCLYRFIIPTITIMGATDVVPLAAGCTFTQAANVINALQYSTGSTTLWARNTAAAPDALMFYTEYLNATSTQCAPTYPINDSTINVNSISGNVNNFVFKWNCPPAVSTTVTYTFDVEVYLDEAGTILQGAQYGVSLGFGGLTSSVAAGTFAAGAGLGCVPGTTYFWHVRTAAPVTGYWSPMQKFNIQQLVAIVPIIGTPLNGAVVEPSNAAFSWSPLTNVTSYKFQLDTGAVFTAPLYQATVNTAGASLPPTVTLERGRTYFWRVMALTPTEGEWSEVANFRVAELATSTVTTSTVTPVTTTQTTITIPQATSTVITMPPATQTVNEVNPTYIWAIIIIGAVLVLAVIVLIVRTRRSV